MILLSSNLEDMAAKCLSNRQAKSLTVSIHMKFRQTHRLILSFPQVAVRQEVREKWRVVEDHIPNPSKWPRKRVEEPTEKASKLHIVVDVVDALLLVQFKSCIDCSLDAKVGAIEILGHVTAIFNGHAHPIRSTWRDWVNGITDADDLAFGPFLHGRSVVDSPVVDLEVEVGGFQESWHQLCRVFENIREVAFHV